MRDAFINGLRHCRKGEKLADFARLRRDASAIRKARPAHKRENGITYRATIAL